PVLAISPVMKQVPLPLPLALALLVLVMVAAWRGDSTHEQLEQLAHDFDEAATFPDSLSQQASQAAPAGAPQGGHAAASSGAGAQGPDPWQQYLAAGGHPWRVHGDSRPRLPRRWQWPRGPLLLLLALGSCLVLVTLL
ncbi:unnamed protein product, partial [Prorocentrum cordatum]